MSEPHHALGIDVGGTKIAAAVVDLHTGKLIASAAVATSAGDGSDAVLGRVAQIVGDLRARVSKTAAVALKGIGIGLPELVTRDGEVASAWNFDWRGRDLAHALAPDLPLVVDSDVRCGALGERCFGAGRSQATFSYVSIGTGISAVHCIDGRIHRGANGFAIHFGSSDLISVGPNGPQAFNLEAFASGAGLAATYAARTGLTGRTAREMIDGAAGQAGLDLIDQSTTAMASYLGQMINMIDPEALIIGGGLGTSPAYFAQLSAKVPRFIWSESCRGLPILPSALGSDAGTIGAACLLRGDQAV